MKTTLIAAVAVALAIATAGHAQSEPTTLTVTQTDHFFHFVDAPPRKGEGRPTAGDQIITRADVQRDGKGAGTNTSVCTYIKGDATCTSTLKLPDGTLSLAGDLSFTAKSSTVTVTGGTGAYAGRSGSATVTQGKHITIVVTLAP